MAKNQILIDIDMTLHPEFYASKAMKHECDSGIFSQELYDEIPQIEAHYQAGKLSYIETLQRLTQVYAQAHAGHPIEDVLRVNFEFAASELKSIRPYFKELFRIVKNAEITLVTSEPQTIAAPLANILGVKAVSTSLAGIYKSVAGAQQFVLTGEVSALALTPEQKMIAVKEHGIALDQILAAYGDSVSDIGMLAAAKYAYVFNPSPELRRIAVKKGWTILTDTARFSIADRRRLTNG